jgi:NAD(P)-dependent dehydrogenase (short-subunit alcohol dehydrogenase family)
VTQAVAPLFHPGTKVLNISSMGSSFDITLRLPIPSVPGYSISKAALNMLSVKQSFFYHDCIVTAVDPGLVKTDMNENGLVSTDICVKAILQMEAKLALNDTGKFLSWKGETLNW